MIRSACRRHGRHAAGDASKAAAGQPVAWCRHGRQPRRADCMALGTITAAESRAPPIDGGTAWRRQRGATRSSAASLGCVHVSHPKALLQALLYVTNSGSTEPLQASPALRAPAPDEGGSRAAASLLGNLQTGVGNQSQPASERAGGRRKQRVTALQGAPDTASAQERLDHSSYSSGSMSKSWPALLPPTPPLAPHLACLPLRRPHSRPLLAALACSRSMAPPA